MDNLFDSSASAEDWLGVAVELDVELEVAWLVVVVRLVDPPEADRVVVVDFGKKEVTS